MAKSLFTGILTSAYTDGLFVIVVGNTENGTKVHNACSLQTNSLIMKGLAHHYHLGESTFILRDIRSYLEFLSHFR